MSPCGFNLETKPGHLLHLITSDSRHPSLSFASKAYHDLLGNKISSIGSRKVEESWVSLALQLPDCFQVPHHHVLPAARCLQAGNRGMWGRNLVTSNPQADFSTDTALALTEQGPVEAFLNWSLTRFNTTLSAWTGWKMSVRCLCSPKTQSILVAIATCPPFLAPDVILLPCLLSHGKHICMCICVHAHVQHGEQGEQSLLSLGAEEWVTKGM